MTDTVPVDSVTPYHRLARRSAPGWWRPVLGTVVILVGSIIAAVIVYGVAFAVGDLAGVTVDGDDGPVLPGLLDTAAALAGIAVALPITRFVTEVIQRRPAGTLSSVLGRVRWRWLAWCLPVAFAAITVSFVMLFALAPVLPVASGEDDTGAWVGLGTFLGSLLLLVLLVPAQAAAEEYVFRGWLLQSVGSLVSPLWPAVAVQAVLFAAVHGWGTVWGFVDLVIWASLLGWLTVRTGGLEAAVALHVANNLMSMTWSVAFGVLDLDVTAADMSLFFLAIDIPVVIGYTLAVTWLARRRRIPTHGP